MQRNSDKQRFSPEMILTSSSAFCSVHMTCLGSLDLSVFILACGVTQKVEAGEAPPRESKPSADGTPKAGEHSDTSFMLHSAIACQWHPCCRRRMTKIKWLLVSLCVRPPPTAGGWCPASGLRTAVKISFV